MRFRAWAEGWAAIATRAGRLVEFKLDRNWGLTVRNFREHPAHLMPVRRWVN
jgi:hypothetical protein